VSLADNAGEAGVSARFALANVKAAGTFPLFWMLTDAELEPPGFIRLTFRTERPASESVTLTVPAVISVPGLPEVELKLAPDAIATALEMISPARAISKRRGVAVASEERKGALTISPQSDCRWRGLGADGAAGNDRRVEPRDEPGER
jgi:hypothetical protein